jgi:hypothetical protein
VKIEIQAPDGRIELNSPSNKSCGIFLKRRSVLSQAKSGFVTRRMFQDRTTFGHGAGSD